MSDGWVKHDGSGMPCAADDQVLVRWSDGEGDEVEGFTETSPASFWSGDPDSWVKNDHCYISEYKIVKPKTRCYLAGPMSGVPYFNFPAFHAAAAKLRAEGFYVFNPAEADIDRSGVDPSVLNPAGDPNGETSKIPGLSRRECLAADLQWIAMEADTIALLPGWEKSSGARAEKALADALNLQVIHLD
jgi:hypothetical protein